jgi:hypothetical protein
LMGFARAQPIQPSKKPGAVPRPGAIPEFLFHDI